MLDISEKMIAQTVISPGISEVYSELLTATRDTNEIYLVPIPHPWLGRTFQDVRLGLAAIEEPVCLLGFTNAVMAYEEPEWHEEAPAFENSPVLAADTASG